MTAFAPTINGRAVKRVTLTIPWRGAWFATVEPAEGTSLTGATTLVVGLSKFVGTVVADRSGEVAGVQNLTVVGGANGWGSLVKPKGYRSVAGVRPLSVARDLAAEVGEALGAFAPTNALQSHYVRFSGPASTVLEELASGVPWYVDRLGVTQVAARPGGAAPSSVVLLDYDPQTQVATLKCEDLTSLDVGMAIADPRVSGDARTIRELQVTAEPDGTFVVRAWLGGPDAASERVASALLAFGRKAAGASIWGPRRYEVVSLDGDALNLAAVNRTGQADILAVEQWPGVAGVYAELTRGCQVLVEFIDGDPSEPIVTHYTPKGAKGWAPVSLSLLGGTAPVARLGDTVECFLDAGTLVSGVVTISGTESPFTGTLTVVTPVVGQITTGRNEVTA